MTITSPSFNTQVENKQKLGELRMALGFQPKPIPFFYEQGDSAVKSLCQNLVWLATAQAMKSKGLIAGVDKVSLDKIDFEKVDEKMLVAAIYGCSNILQCVAKTKKVPSAQITFPRDTVTYRNNLLKEVNDRTFHCKIKGTDSHWFEWAERFMDKVLCTHNAQNIINNIIIKTKRTYVIDVENLASLLLSEAFYNESIDTIPGIAKVNETSADEYKFNRLKGLKKFKGELIAKVCGNINPINAVVKCFNQTLANSDNKSPAIATFIGASGVGKTHLAQTAAECFNNAFSSSYESFVINLEAYSDDKSSLKLFGSGSQFVNSSLGDLTLRVIKNPKQVIIFDEIEKAHSNTIQSLLTLLSSGSATDLTSRHHVDFSECIFIFTSNLGQNYVANHAEDVSIANLIGQQKSGQGLSPEMINRLESGDIAIFKEFTAQELLDYSNKKIDHNKATEYNWPSYLPELLVKSLGGKATPRSLNNQLNKLEAKVSDVVMSVVDFEDLALMPIITIAPEVNLESEYKVAVVFQTKRKKLLDEHKISSSVAISDYHNVKGLLNDLSQGKKFDSVLVENLDEFSADFDELIVLGNAKNIDINVFSKQKNDLVLNIEYEHYYILPEAKQSSLINLVKKITLRADLLKVLPQQLKRKAKVEFDVRVMAQSCNCITIKLHNFVNITPKEIDDIDCDYIKFMSDIDERFEDIFGQTIAKEKLKGIAYRLKSKVNPKVTLPKGYILTGGLGTGKTLLATAMAGECKMPFISVDANELLTPDGANKVKKVFEIADKYSPSIIFFDEAELLLQNRAKTSGIQHLVTNAFLTAMDGISTNDNQVFVLAATNFANDLDPAVSRAGRFEEVIKCDLPNVDEISTALPQLFTKYDLTIMANKIPFIADQLVEESFATINKLLRNTSFNVQNFIDKETTFDILLSLINDEKHGKKVPESDEQHQRLVAYHEAGHLVSYLTHFSLASVKSVSVERREKSSGFCQISINNDIYRNRTTISHFIQSALAGRSAEELFLGNAEDITSGCRSDLKVATEIAKTAIKKFGYSSSGLADLSQFEEYTHDTITEVNKWLGEEYKNSKELLVRNRKLLDLYAELLMEKKHIYAHDIANIWLTYQSDCSSKNSHTLV
jgi:cell division protease FtsH